MNRFRDTAEQNPFMTVHGTSNIEIPVTSTQFKGAPINDFIKDGSKNPGTIITLQPQIIKVSPFKTTSKIEIEMIVASHQTQIEEKIGVRLEIENLTYINEKKANFEEILTTYAPKFSNQRQLLLNTLVQNN